MWIFRTEKINAMAFRALEMAVIQNLMNNGMQPNEIRKYVEDLGRYLGEMLYIGYHARGGRVAESIMDLGKIANSFYIFLFGESLDKIKYVFENQSRVRLHLIAMDGLPTCRGIVSPHKEIKFGSFIIGAINRMLELKRDELEYSRAYCREERCVATGDPYCEIVIEFDVPLEVFRRLREKYGGEYHVR